MSSNSFPYKVLCLKRCIYAISVSVLMQYVLLTLHLLMVNFRVLHPIKWLQDSFGSMFSFSTWCTLIPLIIMIIIYGVIMAKELLSPRVYYGTRFRWFVGTSMYKCVFLLAHIMVGVATVFVYTKHIPKDNSILLVKCENSDNCINTRLLFLICSGIVAACFSFFKEYLHCGQRVDFPIIDQLRILKVRYLITGTIKESLVKTFVPNLYFAAAYWLLSGWITRRWAEYFDRQIAEQHNDAWLVFLWSTIYLLLYSWIQFSIIRSNMHLLKRFFSTFLTETMDLPVGRYLAFENHYEMTLIEALSLSQLPVVQNVAAMQLLYMTKYSISPRRAELFQLSVPGGHPYNWNQLSAQCLCIINAFTDELSHSINNMETFKATPIYTKMEPMETPQKILRRQFNENLGIRHMHTEYEPTTINHEKEMPHVLQRISDLLEEYVCQIKETIYNMPVIFYLFGEPDVARTMFLLSESEGIIYLVEAFAGICSISLKDDQYGVVQATLPEIITRILRLNEELDRLNNVNFNGKSEDCSLAALSSSVQRSLYRICYEFSDYLHEIIADPEDLYTLKAMLVVD